MSIRSKVFTPIIRSLCYCLPSFSQNTLPFYRASFEKFAQYLKIPNDITYTPVCSGHLSMEWVLPPAPCHQVILYFHGGAYLIGSINTHRSIMAKIAKYTSLRVLGIDYRLAPEYPFPAAIEDCVAAYNWLLTTGISPQAIIIAGDSAGGGLAISTLVHLRERGIPFPAAVACMSPWVDFSLTSDSFLFNAKNDPLLNLENGKQVINMYLNGENLQRPTVSSLYADFTGFPPLFIQVSRSEILYADATRLIEKAQQAGVIVYSDIWQNMLHGWQILHQWLPEAEEAIKQLCRFIVKICQTK